MLDCRWKYSLAWWIYGCLKPCGSTYCLQNNIFFTVSQVLVQLKLLEVLPLTLMRSGFGFVSAETKITHCCKWKVRVELNGMRLRKRERETDAVVRFRMQVCPISVSPCSDEGSPTATQISIWPRKKCFISQQWGVTPALTTGDQKLSLGWHLPGALCETRCCSLPYLHHAKILKSKYKMDTLLDHPR